MFSWVPLVPGCGDVWGCEPDGDCPFGRMGVVSVGEIERPETKLKNKMSILI